MRNNVQTENAFHVHCLRLDQYAAFWFKTFVAVLTLVRCVVIIAPLFHSNGLAVITQCYC